MIYLPNGEVPDGPEFDKNKAVRNLKHDARVNHEAFLEGFKDALGRPPETSTDIDRAWLVFRNHVRAVVEHAQLVHKAQSEGFALPGATHKALSHEDTAQLMSRLSGADKDQLLLVLVRLVGTQIVEAINPAP